MGAQIIGTGIALPKRMITNETLASRLGLTPSKIEKRCGIQTRYWIDKGQTTSTLAIDAAKAALQSADIPVAAIDLILVSTTSPDMFFPSVACLVQRGLAARPIPALDINASCSGFLYALSIADMYIRNGLARHVLVIAAEVKSPFLSQDDPATAILFGDGAGAVVLASRRRGIRSIHLHADGSRHSLIRLPAGGSRIPTTHDSLKEGLHTMKMDGKALFREAVKKINRAMESISVEIPLGKIDLFLFHQANLRIIEAVLQRWKIPAGRSHMTIQKVGNTSSSSLPIVLHDSVRTGKLKRGDCVALLAFGGGVTWGWSLIDW